MKDALEFIIKSIVTVADDVKIDEKEEEGVTNYTISVNPTDIGRLIGKEGKVIKAIRTIMRVIAIQRGVRIRVSVLSDQDHSETSDNAEPTIVEENPDSISVEV